MVMKMNNSNIEFLKRIKVDVDVNLINLKNKLKTGEVKVQDLTNKEIQELIKIYKNQIAEKKRKLNNIKNQILNIRNKRK
mgnify:CR=1 FL=1